MQLAFHDFFVLISGHNQWNRYYVPQGLQCTKVDHREVTNVAKSDADKCKYFVLTFHQVLCQLLLNRKLANQKVQQMVDQAYFRYWPVNMKTVHTCEVNVIFKG
jgi:hypothetical protein